MKTILLCTLTLVPALAQMHDNQERTLVCNDHNNWGRLVSVCDVREQTFPASGPVRIDPDQNGGISVKGWSRADVLVRAQVTASALSDVEARQISGQIRFANSGSDIHAQGPARAENTGWSVSYEVFVPWNSDLELNTHNGGIRISDVRGHIAFHTQNGGVHLARLAGDVSGQTTNGGLTVELMGNRWDGKGLDVSTTNGGVKMSVPASYSAHFDTATVNGGIHTDFPVNVQGRIGRQLAFNTGSGGATIHAVTTNGGVHIQKSDSI